jgi:cob(I)alamin adenosyltransferase
MFKIYTKTGDAGQTGLIGGTRVSKAHIRIESYGTVDELNSVIGMVIDLCKNENVVAELRGIQDRLFTLGSALATDPDKDVKMKLPDLRETDITELEMSIDKMNEVLPELRMFVLPGGGIAASTCHLARCVCRRAERLCVAMKEAEDFVPDLVLPYLNRLSDYLFVLSRYLVHLENGAEIPWRPR